jgi:hypothetical protein
MSDSKADNAAACKADPDVRALRELSGAIEQAASAEGTLTAQQREAVAISKDFAQKQVNSMRAQLNEGKPNEAQLLFETANNALAEALVKGDFKPSRDVATGIKLIASEISNSSDFAEMQCNAKAQNASLKNERSGGRA